MGTSFESANQNQLSPDSTDEFTGIIPRAAKHLFDGIESRKRQAKESGHLEPTFEVNVQFVEVCFHPNSLSSLITRLKYSAVQ
jgi:hypothetical protein